MSSLVLLALFGTFTAVLTGVYAILNHAASRRRAVSILEASVGGMSSSNLREEALSPSLPRRLAGSLARASRPIAERFGPADVREKIAAKIVRAGNPAGWDVDRVIVARMAGTVALPVFAFILLDGMGGTVRIAATVIACYAGFIAPTALLDGRIARRQTAIQRALPDTLDLLTISVEAGLGFDAALQQVVQNVPGELSQEIARTLREIQLGISRADALRNLKERTDVEELRGFTLAIIQADTLGISIGNVLRAQSETIRLKRKQRTEEQAMKIPVKILFPLIFCVLPALFVVVLGPGIIRLMDDFFGL